MSKPGKETTSFQNKLILDKSPSNASHNLKNSQSPTRPLKIPETSSPRLEKLTSYFSSSQKKKEDQYLATASTFTFRQDGYPSTNRSEKFEIGEKRRKRSEKIYKDLNNSISNLVRSSTETNLASRFTPSGSAKSLNQPNSIFQSSGSQVRGRGVHSNPEKAISGLVVKDNITITPFLADDFLSPKKNQEYQEQYEGGTFGRKYNEQNIERENPFMNINLEPRLERKNLDCNSQPKYGKTELQATPSFFDKKRVNNREENLQQQGRNIRPSIEEKLDLNLISDGVQYGEGGVGYPSRMRRINTGESQKSEDIDEITFRRGRSFEKKKHVLNAPSEVLKDWKSDLLEVRKDMENRRASLEKVSKFLMRYQSEEDLHIQSKLNLQDEEKIQRRFTQTSHQPTQPTCQTQYTGKLLTEEQLANEFSLNNERRSEDQNLFDCLAPTPQERSELRNNEQGENCVCCEPNSDCRIF